MATDAFGRLRTSEPFTTFNYHPSPLYNITNDNDVWIKDTGNGGSVSYNSNNVYIELTTSTTSDSYAIRTTKAPMDYQPGKSRLIMMSGCMINPVPSAGEPVYARMGLINVASPEITDGVWFEVDGSENTLNWCESVQTVGGGHTKIKIPQSQWVDKFDGAGPSGKVLTMNDMSHNILIVIDQEWLGVGRLRCGFNIEGVTYYAYSFTHGNMSMAYTSSPKQRIGYEIFTEGVATSAYAMRQICSTCMSEGGFFPLGTRNSLVSAAETTISSTDTNVLLLALKLRNGTDYKNGIIKPIGIDVINSANTSCKYELRLLSTANSVINGVISPTQTFSPIANSITESVLNTSTGCTVSGGYTLTSGFVSSRSSTTFGSTDYESLLTRAICTQYDTLVLIVSGVAGNNSKISASIDFIESL